MQAPHSPPLSCKTLSDWASTPYQATLSGASTLPPAGRSRPKAYWAWAAGPCHFLPNPPNSTPAFSPTASQVSSPPTSLGPSNLGPRASLGESGPPRSSKTRVGPLFTT